MKKILVFTLLLVMAAGAAVAAVTYSRDLYEKAVMGDGEAMYQLSLCYMNGLGVAADYDKSDYWLERAAQEGQPNAVAAISAMRGKTGLSDAKRRELAAEEKSERELLEKDLAAKKAIDDAKQKRGDQENMVSIDATTGNHRFTVNGVTFTMVKVDGGTFLMGATEEQGKNAEKDELPIHSVTLSSYFIGQTEVTQELWVAVMGENPSFFNSYGNPKHDTDHRKNYGTNLNRPVESVTWNDCQEFVRRLNEITGKNFRLPTEAEWEFAARGGNKSKGQKYSGSNRVSNVAWYLDNSGDYKLPKNPESSDDVDEKIAKYNYQTHPVAIKNANELGICDMSGNVYEWCSDYYDEDYYRSSPSANPQGPTKGYSHVIRGGSWLAYDRGCRVSNRYNESTSEKYYYIGLRLAM